MVPEHLRIFPRHHGPGCGGGVDGAFLPDSVLKERFYPPVLTIGLQPSPFEHFPSLGRRPPPHNNTLADSGSHSHPPLTLPHYGSKASHGSAKDHCTTRNPVIYVRHSCCRVSGYNEIETTEHVHTLTSRDYRDLSLPLQRRHAPFAMAYASLAR